MRTIGRKAQESRQWFDTLKRIARSISGSKWWQRGREGSTNLDGKIRQWKICKSLNGI